MQQPRLHVRQQSEQYRHGADERSEERTLVGTVKAMAFLLLMRRAEVGVQHAVDDVEHPRAQRERGDVRGVGV